MQSEKFKEYLQEGSLEGLATIPKSDLHNHLSMGGNVNDFLSTNKNILYEGRPDKFNSVHDFVNWSNNDNFRIKELNIYNRYYKTFQQAWNDSIDVFAPSIFLEKLKEFRGSYEESIDSLKGLATLMFYANPIVRTLLPELSLYAKTDINEIGKNYSDLDEILSYNYFKSIDLCLIDQPDFDFKPYKKIFAKAKNAGLLLKAHVGEHRTADHVMRAVETLELDEVHHGIAAASSPQIMKWLANHKIQLNICPTSNIVLGLVPSYKEHPIRKLYDAGIPITINTDDMLIYNSSVSQEYLNLFSCGLMNENELDAIRLYGLDQLNRQRQIPTKINQSENTKGNTIWPQR